MDIIVQLKALTPGSNGNNPDWFLPIARYFVSSVTRRKKNPQNLKEKQKNLIPTKMHYNERLF